MSDYIKTESSVESFTKKDSNKVLEILQRSDNILVKIVPHKYHLLGNAAFKAQIKYTTIVKLQLLGNYSSISTQTCVYCW